MNVRRVQRLLGLLRLLQSVHGYDVAAMAVECGVSRRTVFRDLRLVKLAGVPVEFDEASRRYRLTSTMVLPPLNFTAPEALALLVLCHQSGDRSGAPFQRAALSAAVKLESSLPGRLRDELYGFADAVSLAPRPRAAEPGHETMYQSLIDAAGRRRCVRLRYDSVAEGEIGTKLSPYRLLFGRHAWYVIGRSSLHRQVRTFHLGRIRQLEVLDEPFHVPRGFSIDRYLRNAWHLIPERGPDRQVHLRFAPLVARNVADVIWHKTQRTRLNADGTLDYHVTVSGLWEISWWLLGYGDQVEVVRPKELREIVARRLRAALSQYEPARERIAVAQRGTPDARASKAARV
jgi:proteasome accessory factor B